MSLAVPLGDKDTLELAYIHLVKPTILNKKKKEKEKKKGDIEVSYLFNISSNVFALKNIRFKITYIIFG
jgi:hypothetical protein